MAMDDWADVDILIGELRLVIEAAKAANVNDVEKATIKKAVSEASLAVSRTVTQHHGLAVDTARSALDMAEEVIAAFDGSVAEAQRLRAASSPLCDRARSLIDEARRVQDVASHHLRAAPKE